jgi:hypothetical protein
MQGLASEELLGDLALERDAVGSMLSCHGSSSENPAPRSIPELPICPAPGAHSTQPGNLFRLMPHDARQRLMDNLAEAMQSVPTEIQRRQIGHFWRADPAYGEGVAQRLGLSVPEGMTEAAE